MFEFGCVRWLRVLVASLQGKGRRVEFISTAYVIVRTATESTMCVVKPTTASKVRLQPYRQETRPSLDLFPSNSAARMSSAHGVWKESIHVNVQVAI